MLKKLLVRLLLANLLVTLVPLQRCSGLTNTTRVPTTFFIRIQWLPTLMQLPTTFPTLLPILTQ